MSNHVVGLVSPQHPAQTGHGAGAQSLLSQLTSHTLFMNLHQSGLCRETMGQTFSGIELGNWRETKPSLPEALPLKQGRISASFFQGAYDWAFSQNASHSLDSEITQDHPCAMATRRKVAVHIYHIVAMAAQLREEVRSPGWTSTHGRSPKTCSPRPAAPDASKTPSTLSRRVRDSSSVPGGRSVEAAASAWGPGWARLLFIPTWILFPVPAASLCASCIP